MSNNDYLIDAASRHSVFLQRYSARLERQAMSVVSDALASVIGQIPEDPRKSDIRLIRNYSDTLQNAERALIDELLDLVESEAEFDKALLEQVVNADIESVPRETLIRAVDVTPLEVLPGQRVTIPSMLSSFTRAKASQVTTLLQAGFTEGKTQQELVRDLREIEPLQRHQAASVVRTGTNAISSLSRYQSMLANAELLSGYEWVSTLDGRTSLICMNLDGMVFDFTGNNPVPPAHFSCRSTIIPKVKPEYDLLSDLEGKRPSVGASGAKQVGAKTTYGGWLRKQPASFQDEALGPARAKLFRQGGLSIGKFVNFDGREYTLDELRALHPLAFDKANL